MQDYRPGPVITAVIRFGTAGSKLGNTMEDTINGSRSMKSVPQSKWLSIATSIFCVLAIGCFGVLAVVLVTQGIGLGQNAAETPPRFVSENAGLSMAARSSWLLGSACVAFALGSTVALMMSMRKRLIASWTMLGIFVALFVSLAIVCKPA